VAVVGSRNATDYGMSTTRRLCADLAVSGITVVSGMARGIDTAAHEGALDGGGQTIAVLGSGLARVYPPENRALFRRIGRQGAVVSEFGMLTGPDAHNFPRRNRIISGMSLGTVVVEASRRSGSLITAALAAEQNREVFAVPGSIRSFKSTGTHTLIKQGAKLVEHAQDIIEELEALLGTLPPAPDQSGSAGCPGPAGLSAAETRVMGALGPYPLHIDDLARKLSMAPGALAGILLQLEVKGRVLQSAGKLFSVTDKV
jgi:DNA processing protein